jgi:addiction module HigA family antidote
MNRILYNPPHPGEFIRDTYLEPFGYSCRFMATQLDVSSSTLSRILKGQSSITPEMALRFSKAVGRSAESWLAMQNNYNLWLARKNINLSKVREVNFSVTQ